MRGLGRRFTCPPVRITLVTFFSALWPLPVALLPVGLLIAVPSTEAPEVVDLHASWVLGPELDSSGWRSQVEYALSKEDDAPSFAEMVSWWSESCNGITRDLSVEIVDPDADSPGSLAPSALPLATWLDALSLGLLGDHCALQAEVEMLSGVALAGVASGLATAG